MFIFKLTLDENSNTFCVLALASSLRAPRTNIFIQDVAMVTTTKP